MRICRPNIDELLLGLEVLPSSHLIRKAIMYLEGWPETLNRVAARDFLESKRIQLRIVRGLFESKYNLGMYVRSLKALLRVVGPRWKIVVAVVETQRYADRAFGSNILL